MSHAIVAAFDAKLRALNASGSLTSEDLVKRFPPSGASPVVPSLDDVEFYDDFASPPSVLNERYARERREAERVHGHDHVNIFVKSNKHHKWRKQRQHSFVLFDEEKSRLQEHGFMVSERLGAQSFADIYTRLYTDDLPVYVTSDSILHAWHRSFDPFLVDFETKELMPRLSEMLSSALQVCATLGTVASVVESAAAHAALAEVEFYVAMAQGLLAEQPVTLRVAANTNSLTAMLTSVKNEQSATVTILGSKRDVDFSLFKPRGHYVKTPELQRFFRAMTWLGTVDFRIDGGDEAEDRFQLQCACMAIHVLRGANVLPQLEAFQNAISAITGDGVGSDSMTPQQLHEVLDDNNVVDMAFGARADGFLRALQDEIANQGLSVQAIAGHPRVAGPSRPSRPPTAFTIMGQQFVWSAFIFSKVVFDQVNDGDGKVPRRMTSAVDAAFALFGNDTAASEIAARMANDSSVECVKHRDGLPYASNLVSARQVVDDAFAKVSPATASLAQLWQLALRELSQPSANAATVFNSETWKKRLMNTQLASFTQLRHDTILYAKQSSTAGTFCEYPAGYVDPYPAFWLRMYQLAQRTVQIIKQVTAGRVYQMPWQPQAHFTNFASIMKLLYEISKAQAEQKALNLQQTNFLKTVIEERFGSGATRYAGWYPSLFYTEREDSGKPDHLVADVHTDSPSFEHGDPGGILHVGVGNVNLAMVIVDKTIYAGPVFSHYEFVTPINERLTDSEFSKRLGAIKAPQWARESFLVPMY